MMPKKLISTVLFLSFAFGLLCSGAGTDTSSAHARMDALPASNYVSLALLRIDKPDNPAPFMVIFEVILQAETGVTGVSVFTPNATNLILYTDGDFAWNARLSLPDFASVIAATNGAFYVIITGDSVSITEFTVDTSGVLDSDIYPTPSGLTPAHGATDVPANTLLSWNDPTGAETPYYVGVGVDGMTQSQEDGSFLGGLNVNDTTWDPPLKLENGQNGFGVDYGEIIDGLVGPMNVISGSIVWGDHPLAPVTYPAGRALLDFGSYSNVSFTVLTCDADVDGSSTVNVTDLIALLAGWGPNPGHVADFDGNGSVNVDDLITLLAAWGACP